MYNAAECLCFLIPTEGGGTLAGARDGAGAEAARGRASSCGPPSPAEKTFRSTCKVPARAAGRRGEATASPPAVLTLKFGGFLRLVRWKWKLRGAAADGGGRSCPSPAPGTGWVSRVKPKESLTDVSHQNNQAGASPAASPAAPFPPRPPHPPRLQARGSSPRVTLREGKPTDRGLHSARETPPEAGTAGPCPLHTPIPDRATAAAELSSPTYL